MLYFHFVLIYPFLCNREFWRRHKKKVYVTLGVVGSGFLLYKLYDGHRRRISELEKELEDDMKNDELIKAQLRLLFLFIFFLHFPMTTILLSH